MVFMGLSLLVVLWAETAVDLKLLTPEPLPVVRDMIRDWEAVPFVSLYASDGPCTDGAVDAFVRSWNGTERGCQIDEGAGAAPRDTWKEEGNMLADCLEVKAIEPVE